MTIHILVEGPSERAFLDRWAPRLLKEQPVRVHPHQGKGTLPRDLDAQPDSRHRGLLDQLPAKLRGFSASLDPRTDAVLILVDADDEDVGVFSTSIVAAVDHCAPQIRARVAIAVEETEAFYLGDLRALKLAFPGADFARAAAYQPDSICGTWELFDQIVNDGGGNKVAWAESMGPRVTISGARSRSPSFRRMVQCLLEIAPVVGAKKKIARRKTQGRPRAKPSGKR